MAVSQSMQRSCILHLRRKNNDRSSLFNDLFATLNAMKHKEYVHIIDIIQCIELMSPLS